MNSTFETINDSTFRILIQTSKLDSEELVFTDVTVFKNIKWALCVNNSDDIFYCHLISEGCNNVWKAKVNSVCRWLRNDKSVVSTTRFNFDIDSVFQNAEVFSCDDISTIPADCLTNGKITLECEVEILKIFGNYPDRSINFKESSELSDTIMMVGDETFYVNKQVLANSSPVFKKMFDSEDMEEIVHLKDENARNFLDFLQMLYNVDVQIEASAIADLLKFSQMFETPSVTQKCELFLFNVPKWRVTLEDKKMYAEKYGLEDLAAECELDEKKLDKKNQSVFSRLISYFF